MFHNFKKFIVEEEKQKKPIASVVSKEKKITDNESNKTSLPSKLPRKKPEKYLSHIEDAIIDHGHEGVKLIADCLDDAHKLLTGHKAKANYQVKYDGGTSIIFGIHPETNQFFIAAKSAPHEKNDKLNYSKEDIQNNYDDSKLKQQLVVAFYHLPKILPKNTKAGESYGADIMHTNKDIKIKDKHVYFQPNSIKYSAPSDSSEGAMAKKSKIGVVIHTKHKEDGSSIPIDKKERNRFIPHPDVNNIDPTLNVDPKKYTPDNMKEFYKHRDAASKLYKSMQPESFDAAMEHAPDIHKYIHVEHKNGIEPNIEALIDHLGDEFKNSLNASKTDKNKKEKTSKHTGKLDAVHNHSAHLDKTLQLHTHLMRAKDVLFHVMAKNIPWIHSLNGLPVNPEGIIAFNQDGTAVKYVDRTAYNKQPDVNKKLNKPKKGSK